jgi:hypothetical protein
VCENGMEEASTNVLQLFSGRFRDDSQNYRSATSQQTFFSPSQTLLRAGAEFRIIHTKGG